MRGFFLKLNYEKGLLGKEKKRIKKYKTGKIHKFYYERKKWDMILICKNKNRKIQSQK